MDTALPDMVDVMDILETSCSEDNDDDELFHWVGLLLLSALMTLLSVVILFKLLFAL